MPTPLREQLDTKLRAFMEAHSIKQPPHGGKYFCADYESLLTDLTRCLTREPDREALTKLLWGKHQLDLRATRVDLESDLMAWATGQPAQPEWCEHRRFVDDQWVKQDRVTGAWNMGIPPDRPFCDACGALRPEGR